MVRLNLVYDDLGLTVRISSRVFYVRAADPLNAIYMRLDDVWEQMVHLLRSHGGEDPFSTVEVESVEFNENFVPSLFSLCERVLHTQIRPLLEHTLPLSTRITIQRLREGH